MSPKELFEYLTETMRFSTDDMRELEGKKLWYVGVLHSEYCLLERHIDGDSFADLSREDFSLIFPSKDKFLLASKLYKIAKNARVANERLMTSTESLLNELEEVRHFGSSPPSVDPSPLLGSRTSTPPLSTSRSSTPLSSSRSSTPSVSHRDKRRCVERAHDVDAEFRLPVFSPDVKRCIEKDAFYTSTQRNRLIKEACLALCGFCWEKERPVSNIDKRKLAKSLCQLAPKSLSDSGKDCKPEVSIILYPT